MAEKEFKTVADVSNAFDALEKKTEELKEIFDKRDPELQKSIDDIRGEQETLSQQMKKLSEDKMNNDYFATMDDKKKAVEYGKVFYCLLKGRGDEKAQEYAKEINGLYEKVDLGTPLVADSTTGSFTVDVQYLEDVARVALESSEILPLVTRIPMNGVTAYVPAQNAAASFTYISSDGGAVTESNPTFAQKTLTAYTYALYIGVSEALMEDNIVNLGAYFRMLISEAMQSKLESEFLVGAGAPTTGVFEDTSANITTMSENTAEGLEMSYIKDMISDLNLGERKGAVFMMNPGIWDILVNMRGADGHFFIRDIQSEAKRMLRGFPVKLSDEANSDAASTGIICLGNPKYMYWGDRLGLEIKYYPNTQYAVTYTEAMFRARFRMAYVTAVPGAFSVLNTGA